MASVVSMRSARSFFFSLLISINSSMKIPVGFLSDFAFAMPVIYARHLLHRMAKLVIFHIDRNCHIGNLPVWKRSDIGALSANSA